MNFQVNALLEEGSLQRFRPIGVFGKPAWQSHLQLRTLVRQRLGNLHADYFAIPSVNSETGAIRWLSTTAGSPKRWNELSDEERTRHEPTLIRIQDDIRSLATELSLREAPGTAGFAVSSLLESSLRTPQENTHLFLVDQQPVLAFWGHEDHSGTAGAAAWQEGPNRLPDLPPPERVGPDVASPNPPAVNAAAESETTRQLASPTPAADSRTWTRESGAASETRIFPSSRRYWPKGWPISWLRALLGLLLLLLLLMLLSWLLPRSCAGPRLAGSQAADAGGGWSAPGATTTREPGIDLPGATATTQPPSTQTDQADVPNPKAAQAPNAPPDLQPKGQVEPPRVDEELSLANRRPDDRDLSFLKGRWKAGEGLVDRQSGQPLEIALEFGKDGKGEMLLRKPDGTQCKAAVRADMMTDRLGISGQDRLACPDGSSYPAPKVECRLTRDAQTECAGLNPDGSRYFMEVRRR
jgi:hypothetical protein